MKLRETDIVVINEVISVRTTNRLTIQMYLNEGGYQNQSSVSLHDPYYITNSDELVTVVCMYYDSYLVTGA